MAKRTGKSLLCRRYAVALFDHAAEHKAVANVGKELSEFAALVEQSAELKAAFNNHTLPADKIAGVAETLLKRGGASDITIRFCRLLASNRRIHLVSGIAAIYRELLAESNNEISVELTSSAELGAAQLKDITDGLRKFTGKNIAVAKKINPALLGGFTVKVGSHLLDGSLAGKLERMEQYLKKAGN